MKRLISALAGAALAFTLFTPSGALAAPVPELFPQIELGAGFAFYPSSCPSSSLMVVCLYENANYQGQVAGWTSSGTIGVGNLGNVSLPSGTTCARTGIEWNNWNDCASSWKAKGPSGDNSNVLCWYHDANYSNNLYGAGFEWKPTSAWSQNNFDTAFRNDNLTSFYMTTTGSFQC